MAHILVVSFPATGHLNPTLPVVAELVRRGHRVDVVVPEPYRAPVEAAGGRVLTYPSSVPVGWSGIAIPRRPDADQLARARLDTVRETLAPLPVIADLAERPDVVVYDVLGCTAGRLLSLAWDRPSVVTCPTFAGNESFSPYARAVEEGGLDVPDADHPAMREAEAVLRSTLDDWGLHDVAVPDFDAGVGERCRLVFVPRAFHPGHDTFDERFRFVGPCLRPGADDDGWSPPSGRPVVLVSLGTLGYDEAATLLRRAVAAVGRIGGHAVVSLGDVDPEVFGDLRDEHVELHRRVPQLAVLRHASAFVSHAGMNSAMEALSWGVPLVEVPQTGEQRLVAGQVDALDCGRVVDPDDVDVESLTAALDEVRTSRSVAAGVAAMRKVIGSTGGAVAAADAIEARAVA